MIESKAFTTFLDSQFDFICGVPCSYFKRFLIYLGKNEQELRIKHILATREDEAVGIASGVAFSNKHVLVYMQNSGLGNIGDALTSLAQLYKLPMLLLISYRGLESDKDFPEHSIMGEINEPFLKAIKIPYHILTEEKWQEEMCKAITEMKETSLPVAVLVKDGVLSK